MPATASSRLRAGSRPERICTQAATKREAVSGMRGSGRLGAEQRIELAGAVEAMQPLMNMITFTARSREAIVAFLAWIAGWVWVGTTGSMQMAIVQGTMILDVILVVVLLILMLLLRSILAPVLLIITTVLSFGTAMGRAAARSLASTRG